MIQLRNQFVTHHSQNSAARISAWRPGEAAPAPRPLSVRGFSLLEVMLAVVILGLGILGISAVFAGAAKQQQTSSEIQRSVAIGLNAKASLNRKLGSIVGLNPGDLPDRQWRWLRFFDQDIMNANPSPTLDVRTIIDGSNQSSQRPFFRVEAPGVNLFENQSADLFSAAGQGTYTNGSNSPPFDEIPSLPHNLIIPGSLAFSVTVESAIGGSGTAPPVVLTPVSTPPDEDDIGQNATYDFQGGGGMIRVVFNPNGGGGVYIDSFDLTPLFGGDPNLYIQSITALPYEWKNHKLLSLNERLLYVVDDRFPPAGSRPENGFVLFFRKLDEISEAMVMTYALLPQSRPQLDDDQFPVITPEFGDPTSNSDGSMVREADAQIRWDNARQQYYVYVEMGSDEAWLATPGQLLLMKECPSCSSFPERGADNVVKVISQLPDDLNPMFVRGYLDDVPRVNLTAVVPQRNNVNETVTFYALYPEFRNADQNDDTLWKVRPVDARLIPIILR